MIGEPNGHSWFIRAGTGDERIIHTGSNNVIMEVVKTTNKVQLKLDKSQKNQRWIIEPLRPVLPAIYVIKNVKTGTVMDLEHSTKGEGVKIFGFQPNGGANQKWKIQAGSKAPNVAICSVATDAYAAYPTLEKGENLRSSNKSQEYIISLADKGFHISPVQQPEYVLDMSGAGEANETEICLWIKHDGDHQKWYFEAVEN
ncbi:unnamed protein product [Rhizoctonia solani]|uniref:Ricin B lectin domain-containing protein n=1 Tax=Rhizoctonia solani TaxID=456999 RepID=A0A8H3GBL6_9AGAM|nr:unnamed protein product [Rhizoctonia solani]